MLEVIGFKIDNFTLIGNGDNSYPVGLNNKLFTYEVGSKLSQNFITDGFQSIPPVGFKHSILAVIDKHLFIQLCVKILTNSTLYDRFSTTGQCIMKLFNVAFLDNDEDISVVLEYKPSGSIVYFILSLILNAVDRVDISIVELPGHDIWAQSFDYMVGKRMKVGWFNGKISNLEYCWLQFDRNVTTPDDGYYLFKDKAETALNIDDIRSFVTGYDTTTTPYISRKYLPDLNARVKALEATHLLIENTIKSIDK